MIQQNRVASLSLSAFFGYLVPQAIVEATEFMSHLHAA
jgi:hypothetical protein